MATLGRTADRFPEKLKCQTFEWKTDLCRHHVDQPPPLTLLIGRIERSSGHINNYLLNLGSGRLFQLLPEPFHGEHLQTPDRLPQGEISLFQDIRFNWNKRAHSDTEYLKQYFLSRIFGLTRSGPCWTTCTMERYAKCR